MKRYLLGLFVFALLLRLGGIMWGWAHPDENFSLSARVLAGEIVPLSFFYPPLLNYINAIAYGILYVCGRYFAFWHSTSDFREQWFQNPAPFYFVGRFITASLGALSAPLAAMIASKLSIRSAVLIGLILALLPADVLLSHLSKGDVGCSTAVLFLIWTYLRAYESPETKSAILMGLASALVISFKQSGLFFVLPFYLLALLHFRKEEKLTAKFIFQSIGAGIFFGLIFNVGILGNFQEFLHYQRLQTYVSVKEWTFPSLFASLWTLLKDPFLGTSLFGIFLFFLVPFCAKDARVRVIWTATLLSLILFGWLTGDRVQSHIYLPLILPIVLLGAIQAVQFAERFRLAKAAVIIWITYFAFYTALILKQALAPSNHAEVAQAIIHLAKPSETKILASKLGVLDGLGIDPQALKDSYARDQESSCQPAV